MFYMRHRCQIFYSLIRMTERLNGKKSGRYINRVYFASLRARIICNAVLALLSVLCIIWKLFCQYIYPKNRWLHVILPAANFLRGRIPSPFSLLNKARPWVNLCGALFSGKYVAIHQCSLVNIRWQIRNSEIIVKVIKFVIQI